MKIVKNRLKRDRQYFSGALFQWRRESKSKPGNGGKNEGAERGKSNSIQEREKKIRIGVFKTKGEKELRKTQFRCAV